MDTPSKVYDRDIVIVLNDLRVRPTQPNAARSAAGRVAMIAVAPTKESGSTLHLFNGKSAPAISPIEIKQGERVRLRVINAGQEPVPLCLSGHHLEVVSINGSDPGEPHVFRDTICLNPSDRCDLEFTATNPGVWSLASERYDQSTNDGKFPGGIACVVRYAADSDNRRTP